VKEGELFKKSTRILFYLFLILPMVLSIVQPLVSTANESKPVVYIVPIESHIERGLQAFLERAFTEADEADADHIIIEMNTFGGAVDAASGIGRLFRNTQIPITVFVNHDAISAGAYIALNADTIIMVPTAKMGAATVVDSTGTAGDAKAMSMWIDAMASAAEANGRDALYAKAMVDMDMEIEGLTTKGMPLTFSANEALEYGYAEHIASTRNEALQFLGLEDAKMIEIGTTFAEKVARFVTSPIVMPILFSLGSLGLMLELYSPGFGIPGTIGASALVLFFFGHMIAGFAGWESLVLFILGMVLIIFELLAPGFGIFGILGISSVIGSLALASFDITVGLKSVGWAALITFIVGALIIRYTNKRGLWTKLILNEELSAKEGESRFLKKSELVGKSGVTITRLRPAGLARIENVRYDVVSDGGLIEIDQPITVIYVEGTRIVVTTQVNDK
jgi:membrane-bound serine protease (ClpP class)